MTWHAHLLVDNEIDMLSSSDPALPGWLQLPDGWVAPARAEHDGLGPSPDRLMWDPATESTYVEDRP